MATVYVAYQADCTEFQSVYIHQGIEIDDAMCESNVIKTARACLAGWWSASQNKELATAGSGEIICLPSCFIVRMIGYDWQAYKVDFTSDDLTECVVAEINSNRKSPNEAAPVAWPEFVTKLASGER